MSKTYFHEDKFSGRVRLNHGCKSPSTLVFGENGVVQFPTALLDQLVADHKNRWADSLKGLKAQWYREWDEDQVVGRAAERAALRAEWQAEQDAKRPKVVAILDANSQEYLFNHGYSIANIRCMGWNTDAAGRRYYTFEGTPTKAPAPKPLGGSSPGTYDATRVETVSFAFGRYPCYVYKCSWPTDNPNAYRFV